MCENHPRKLEDIKQGNYYERKVLKWLNVNQCPTDKLFLYRNKFNTFDFSSSKVIGELKSRNIKHDDYNDLMIGLNKLEEAEIEYEKRVHKKYTFYFLCKDGLYSWDFKKDEYDIRMGGRCDRGRDERKLCGFIDTRNLVKLTTKINSIS